MLGWHISIYRQNDGGPNPATFETEYGARLGVWQTGIGGLNWVDELVLEGKAIDLGGSGYPLRYTAKAEHLIPQLYNGPPEAKERWSHGADDTLAAWWEGQTVIDGDVCRSCDPGERLLIEAWDES